MNLEITGGHTLSGSITTNASKNGGVVLLCAAMLNRGVTTLKNMPRIEEIHRLIEVLESIGYSIRWEKNTLTITPPTKPRLETINAESATKTRSIIMFIAPLAHYFSLFTLPKSGGCKLGLRTVRPHFFALERLGISIESKHGHYRVTRKKLHPNTIVLYESGDTVTENAIMAASRIPGKTVIKYASANYQVQELCFFLETLGVKIEGAGTTTLTVHGKKNLRKNITYTVSEDPTDSMFFIATAIVTKSALTIKRCPIEFLELEFLTLEKMGFQFSMGKPYTSANKKTKLVDVTTKPSRLVAPPEKVYARPYPGLNIDNLPFFAVIATQAKGRTLIHDWVYEKRAIYYTELDRLGAQTTLADPHRVFITGPTKLEAAELICPPALRPATILLVAMLGAKGTSTLRNTYSIDRGYENLVQRLNMLGARVKVLDDFTL